MQGSSISAVHFERTAHPGPLGGVSADQRRCVVRDRIELSTFRFSGAIQRSRVVASRGLVCHLAASTVAHGRLASLTACLRWLPFWLPASGDPAVTGLHISSLVVSARAAAGSGQNLASGGVGCSIPSSRRSTRSRVRNRALREQRHTFTRSCRQLVLSARSQPGRTCSSHSSALRRGRPRPRRHCGGAGHQVCQDHPRYQGSPRPHGYPAHVRGGPPPSRAAGAHHSNPAWAGGPPRGLLRGFPGCR